MESTESRVPKAGAKVSTPKEYRLDGFERIDLVGPNLIREWIVLAQGYHRNTCVPFAVAACIELQRAQANGALEFLSPQFLYWHIRKHIWGDAVPPGWAGGATKLGQAKAVLESYGICKRESAPYHTTIIDDSPIDGAQPSEEANAEALTNRIAQSSPYEDYPPGQNSRPAHGVALEVYQELEQDRPVAVAVPQFWTDGKGSALNWHVASARNSGVIPDPGEDAPQAQEGDGPNTPGHVVCVVGFQPDWDETTGGWFIFRNSWGPSWARLFNERQTPPELPASGYGAISATYVEKHCWEWFSPRLGGGSSMSGA